MIAHRMEDPMVDTHPTEVIDLLIRRTVALLLLTLVMISLVLVADSRLAAAVAVAALVAFASLGITLARR